MFSLQPQVSSVSASTCLRRCPVSKYGQLTFSFRTPELVVSVDARDTRPTCVQFWGSKHKGTESKSSPKLASFKAARFKCADNSAIKLEVAAVFVAAEFVR